MVAQCIIACIIVLIAASLAIGLVRFAANLVVILLVLGGCGYIIYQIMAEQLQDWFVIISYAVGTGIGVAILSIPVLPLSSFWKGK